MRKPPMPDCYDYVRRYYGVPAYIGARVRIVQTRHTRRCWPTRDGHPAGLDPGAPPMSAPMVILTYSPPIYIMGN